jgi:hypothetical protein
MGKDTETFPEEVQQEITTPAEVETSTKEKKPKSAGGILPEGGCESGRIRLRYLPRRSRNRSPRQRKPHFRTHPFPTLPQ